MSFADLYAGVDEVTVQSLADFRARGASTLEVDGTTWTYYAGGQGPAFRLRGGFSGLVGDLPSPPLPSRAQPRRPGRSREGGPPQGQRRRPNDIIREENKTIGALLPYLPAWLVLGQFRRSVLTQVEVVPAAASDPVANGIEVMSIESDNDPLVEAKLRELLRDTYPSAVVHTFHGTGHFTYLSEPAQCAEVLSGFLGPAQGNPGEEGALPPCSPRVWTPVRSCGSMTTGRRAR